MSSGVLLSSCVNLSLSSHTKLSSVWRFVMLQGNKDKMAEQIKEQKVKQRGREATAHCVTKQAKLKNRQKVTLFYILHNS